MGFMASMPPWQAVRPAAASAAAPPTGTVYASQPVLVPPAARCGARDLNLLHYRRLSPPRKAAPTPAPAPLSAAQLDALVAPIALYPDALVAQVLAASANPDQVAYADDWLAQNKSLTGTALAQAVDQQSWDPSVKALTQFPSVLDNLAHNLSWTSSLGQAFANSTGRCDGSSANNARQGASGGDAAIQTPDHSHSTAPNTIVIQPANPQVVYVPQYNPAVVYGAPVVVPLYVPPPVPVASVGVFFGPAVTVGATFGGGGWGRLRLGLERLEM